MPALNNVQLIGHLGRDPETRFTPTGKKVCNFTLAVNRRAANSDPDWFQVEAWERLGEVCQQYLGKGQLAFVEGRLQTDRWTDEQGEPHFRTKVVASGMQILGRKAGAEDTEPAPDALEAEPAF